VTVGTDGVSTGAGSGAGCRTGAVVTCATTGTGTAGPAGLVFCATFMITAPLSAPAKSKSTTFTGFIDFLRGKGSPTCGLHFPNTGPRQAGIWLTS
jgi:hypothetical protein